MKVQPPEPIALTEQERALVERIDFEPDHMRLHGRFYDVIEQSCEAAKELSVSLIEREAIPKVRWAYFTDPALNIKLKRSRMEVFEGNGTRGGEILEHPHFLPYLRYFIFGPQLPQPTISGFCELVNRRDDRELFNFARREVRQRGLDRHRAAEEFFKLALECGLYEGMARLVRDAALKTR